MSIRRCPCIGCPEEQKIPKPYRCTHFANPIHGCKTYRKWVREVWPRVCAPLRALEPEETAVLSEQGRFRYYHPDELESGEGAQPNE